MQIFQPFKKIEDFSEISVQTQTLDNFCLEKKINNIDVLKIDTEGNELNVLKGAKKLLEQNKINIIYTEISETKKRFLEKEKSVIDFLNSYNFELKKKYQIKSFSILSDLKASDNLFINKALTNQKYFSIIFFFSIFFINKLKSEKQVVKIEKLRQEGEEAHKTDKHKESVQLRLLLQCLGESGFTQYTHNVLVPGSNPGELTNYSDIIPISHKDITIYQIINY